ncbi:MAG: hypothetical protein IT437_06545 [Phycisphaerales bacterium]|nr:hypothetical protein [Phycisphaerales bacterium]
MIGPFLVVTPGPQALALMLGIDKVLTSRVLKAVRATDTVSATHSMPGPEPLRRLVKAAARKGAASAAVAEAGAAVDQFEALIRDRVGDRGQLDAILSAWDPRARREFEVRRKQAAFKAMSQLRGARADAILATVLLHPSDDGRRIDVVWLSGLIGLRRVRPGVRVKLSTRRMALAEGARRPTTLEGVAVEDPGSLVLTRFCSDPPPRLTAQRVGEVVHYTLGDGSFGPESGVDAVFAEVNRAELPRYLPPPPTAESARKSYFFAEVSTSATVMQFDVLVHRDLYPASAASGPALRLYDTAFEGIASVNDRSRDMDVLDVLESVEPLGAPLARVRSADVPRYAELLDHTFGRLAWDAAAFRGYRCRIEYPIYGSQVTMVFEPQTEG